MLDRWSESPPKLHHRPAKLGCETRDRRAHGADARHRWMSQHEQKCHLAEIRKCAHLLIGPERGADLAIPHIRSALVGRDFRRRLRPERLWMTPQSPLNR